MFRILIIGNGFDLAHELPTRYEDFLDFCYIWINLENNRKNPNKFEVAINCIDAEKKQNDPNANINTHVVNSIKAIFNSNTKESIDQEYFDIHTSFAQKITMLPKQSQVRNVFYDYIKDNLWIQHFRQVRFSLGKNWIDFETEISFVLSSLNDIISDNSDNNNVKKRNSVFLNKYIKLKVDYLKSKTLDSFKPKKDLISLMDSDLSKLIRAFEIYLSGVVDNLPVKKRIPIIENTQFDFVLSFNYTNTYRRYYKPDLADKDICFIHGNAKINNSLDSCNLVLGVQRSQDRDSIEEPELIVFKKYYQRIFKRTDSQYLDLLNKQKHYKNLKFDIYVFGHSLDVTDQEVLKAFIDNDQCNTTIYHHDRTAMGLQIKNLFQFIDHDTMIKMSSGVNPQICFISQNEK